MNLTFVLCILALVLSILGLGVSFLCFVTFGPIFF